MRGFETVSQTPAFARGRTRSVDAAQRLVQTEEFKRLCCKVW